MKRILFSLFLAGATVPVYANEPITLRSAQPTAGIPESLRREAEAARERAITWLMAQQAPEGNWSNPEFPALTALPLWAMAKSGHQNDPAVGKATAYLLSCVNENGSICREPKEKRKGGGLCNYNTALGMVALNAVGREDLIPVVQKARTFLAGTQHFGDDIYEGGMGYDAENGQPYADLSNSYLAYEAMRLTENVEDLRKQGDAHADLNWEAAQKFIQRVQNLPGSNDQPWATTNETDRGGFAYNPDSTKAGTYTDPDGTVRLRSYGSMTYAGLLSFIYAKVDKTDPRVQSAFEWTLRNWTLDQNPGMNQQGLYYYLHTMAKALSAMGQDVLTLADGRQVNWRETLLTKLISIQRTETDGSSYWKNDEGRWWEADPILVTSYSLLALQFALGE